MDTDAVPIKAQPMELPRAQQAKPIEVDEKLYFPFMTDWGVHFWLEGQFDEGHGG